MLPLEWGMSVCASVSANIPSIFISLKLHYIAENTLLGEGKYNLLILSSQMS